MKQSPGISPGALPHNFDEQALNHQHQKKPLIVLIFMIQPEEANNK